jgi:hypothetical protein
MQLSLDDHLEPRALKAERLKVSLRRLRLVEEPANRK